MHRWHMIEQVNISGRVPRQASTAVAEGRADEAPYSLIARVSITSPPCRDNISRLWQPLSSGLCRHLDSYPAFSSSQSKINSSSEVHRGRVMRA
jgi:hypothetical protein